MVHDYIIFDYNRYHGYHRKMCVLYQVTMQNTSSQAVYPADDYGHDFSWVLLDHTAQYKR